MIDFTKLWDILIKKFPTFMNGTGITLKLAFFTVVFGSLLGMVVAIARKSKILPLRWLLNAFVAFIRGTPLLVQTLLMVYGVIPWFTSLIGIKLDREVQCCVALIINSSAYMAEIIRAGIESVDRGQTEAAQTLGLTGFQTMIHIILPQAIKTTLPAVGNEFIAIIKESSIMYAVGVYELTYEANKIASTNFFYIETMLVAAMIYFVLTYGMSQLLKLLERRLHRGEAKLAQ